jgi:hypothetical protein
MLSIASRRLVADRITRSTLVSSITLQVLEDLIAL